jgi:hypothetical protein
VTKVNHQRSAKARVFQQTARGNWWAAVRCVAEDQIAVYSMTPGTNWHLIDTVSYPGGQLSRPLVTTYFIPGYSVGNVAYETSAGDQILAYYLNSSTGRNLWDTGLFSP